MPVIKSAIKKLRKDKVREKENDAFRTKLESVVRTAKKTKTDKAISAAFSLIDKAAKKRILHQNKAARMKASLVKKDSGVSAPKAVKKTVSKTANKVSKKKKTASKK